MTDREIMIARRSGAVTDNEGNRIFIKAGRTIADGDHPLVRKYPRAWATVNVSLRTDGSGTPVAAPDADSFDPAREGAQDALYVDPELVEHAEQFRRLATALRDLNVLPDRPLTAAEVVEHTVSIVDEWQQRPGEDAVIDVAETADRETVRAWAREHGLVVADKGRLAVAVYDAYHAAGN